MSPGAPKFNLPPVSTAVLKNRLKAFAVPLTDLPLVSLHLIVPRGAEADPPGKAGLSHLAAEMLILGTKGRSATELAAEVDGLGASLSSRSIWDGASLHLMGLSEDLDRLLGLLLEVYTEPAFRPEEFEQLKRRRIAALEQQKDESEIVADERFQQLLFQGTPYDHPAYGTLQSIPEISLEEVQNYYRDQFLPEGSFLLLAGDLRPDEVFERVGRDFPPAGRPGGGEERGFPSPPRPAIRTVLVDRPELTQSQIRLGHIGLAHNHPDYIPFEVMNYVLGAGGFSSRLMRRIRSDLGYTYGIRASLEPRKRPGPFTISTFASTENTFACVGEIFSVIRSFIVQEPTPEEREEAINFLTGSYPMRFETLNQIAQRIGQAELHGLGLDFLSAYPDRVSAVSLAEMARCAGAHLHPDGMRIVVVGRAEKFLQDFERWGPVETVF